ncbi:MAG: hypothetical protein N2Z22_07670 [Turneriella sp.]|nr:hypothetical protein [Turneriella sp.]
MFKGLVRASLQATYEASPVYKIKPKDKFAIWSDIHLGDGSRRDDFRHNADLFYNVLQHYYNKKYKLVLNGDIEELLKFRYPAIQKQWREIIGLFQKFAQSHRLFKIEGNHDPAAWLLANDGYPFTILPGLRLKVDCGEIFLLHGHQSDTLYQIFPKLIVWLLRTFVFPLGIMNYTVAYNSRKQYRTEKRIYDFARQNRLLTIIGHTHRPLFESRTKMEELDSRIDALCRIYHQTKDEKRRQKIRSTVAKYRALLKKDRDSASHRLRLSDKVYGEGIPVPCLFNSGSAIGKGGITCIEIKRGRIFLVYWGDSRRTKKSTEFNLYRPARFLNEHYFKFILRREKLDYLFSRIELLR